MINIDYIMELIEWNQSEENQQKGRNLAKKVKYLDAFMQPRYGKCVWDNCAKILSSRSDEELEPYLYDMMEWLQDMNWPGAWCILDRLKKFQDKKTLNFIYEYSLKQARKLEDETWRLNLNTLKINEIHQNFESDKTKIGLEFELNDSLTLSDIIELLPDNYIWTLQECEIYSKEGESLYRDDPINKCELKNVIQNEVIFANLQGYNEVSDITKIDTYTDFKKSRCKIIILLTDCACCEIYSNSNKELEIIKKHLENKKIVYEFKTMKNDTRKYLYF